MESHVTHVPAPAFVLDAEHTPAAFAELCRRYGISRKTGYKWLDRYRQLGPDSSPTAPIGPGTAPCDRADPDPRDSAAPEVVALGRPEAPPAAPRHPPRRGGPRPIDDSPDPRPAWPRPAPPPLPAPRPSRPARTPITRPNVVWSVDFKGQFTLGDGRYCYPLTVQDAYSRYLLACEGLEGPLLQPTQLVFRRLFREYGLPARIRPDNGQPFASCALGRHERMHRDLKAETTRPPAASFRAQQRRFDAFRHTFNEVRPPEALAQRRPAMLDTPSDRLSVPRGQPIVYPEHFEIRRVSTNGGIRWNRRWVNVSHVLATLPVGHEPLTTGTWNVFFGPVHLGWLDERDYRIHDRRGHSQRKCHLSPIR
ncbi:MAG: helix-turn-helix domain-containing protein [Gemmatimonadales bacterium]